MSAPSIPNLNTLRSGRGRGRGRGLGGFSVTSTEEEKARHDQIVRQTDQDASVSRMSAVDVGYLEDPYAELFLSSDRQRRFPIINRGTYVRTRAIDRLVDGFIGSNPSQKKQIISLGAGTDTRYFRLMSRYGPLDKPNWVYHEVDFPENTARKIAAIGQSGDLASCVRKPVMFSEPSAGQRNRMTNSPTVVDGPLYHVHPLDLRSLDSSKEPPVTFDAIDPSLPTLILSECCLCYLGPAAADTAALYFSKHFFPPSTPLGMVLYEPIKPDDAFGKTMISNLAARGIVLQTLKKYGSLDAQSARMRAYGFEGSNGVDVNELWKKGVDEEEKARVAGLEMVDEIEEWELLAGHYCVAWGWRDGDSEGIWKPWKTILD